MNKNDLVKSLSNVLSTRAEARLAVEHIFELMKGTLKEGQKIIIHGFGSFQLVLRRAKKGRNPRTGAEVPIPPRRIVKFKPSRDLVI